jgi:hypothetical protein
MQWWVLMLIIGLVFVVLVVAVALMISVSTPQCGSDIWCTLGYGSCELAKTSGNVPSWCAK